MENRHSCNEKDFEKNYQKIQELIENNTLLEFANANKDFSVVFQFINLFGDYYRDTLLLCNNSRFVSIFSIARSALECFTHLKLLIDCYPNVIKSKHYEKIRKLNVKQLFLIYNEYNDENIIMEIKKCLLDLNLINNNSTDSDILKIAKEIKDFKINKEVVKVLVKLPEYSHPDDGAATVYRELCGYSHNNIYSIIDRYFINKGDKVYFDNNKDNEHIKALKYMFIACSNYIIQWINNIIKPND